MIVQRRSEAQRRRSTSSYSRVHACPSFVWGLSRSEDGRSILRSASQDDREFPLPRLRSRRCTRCRFAGPDPGAGSLSTGSNVPLACFFLRKVLLLTCRDTDDGDLATDGQMKPQARVRLR